MVKGLQTSVQVRIAATVLLLAGTVSVTLRIVRRGVRGSIPVKTPTAVPLARAIGAPCSCQNRCKRGLREKVTAEIRQLKNFFRKEKTNYQAD